MDKIKKNNNLKNDLLFQQDKIRCHKSLVLIEVIKVIFGKNKIGQLANSPDFYSIDIVWSVLNLEISKRKNSNIEELRNSILNEWRRFFKELRQKKTAEFNEKINFCQKKGGIILNINQKIYKKIKLLFPNTIQNL